MTDQTEPLRQSDWLDPARAVLVQAALDLPDRCLPGDPLPPFFHQFYFWTPQPPGELGRDGHPRVGGVIPDMGLPRRMWAGGRLTFHTNLIAGKEATKTTICENAVHKVGRSGPLGFVTLRHEISQNGQLCVTEWQDLVYREDPAKLRSTPETLARATGSEAPRSADPAGGSLAIAAAGTGLPAPASDPARDARPATPPLTRRIAAETRSQVFDTTLLFRYSAATCNGHRIHYDRDYAQKVEGYRGLVVHGPLLAQCLMLMAQDRLGKLGKFSFRAHSPVMDFEPVDLCCAEAEEGLDLWVKCPDGRLGMSASASPA